MSGYSPEFTIKMKQAEIEAYCSDGWFADWGISALEMVQNINQAIDDFIPQGVFGTELDMDVVLSATDHDQVLAFIYILEIRLMILTYLQDRYKNVNPSDGFILQTHIDITTINLDKSKNRLLDIRGGRPQPNKWRN